jgi:hypothetical protein
MSSRFFSGRQENGASQPTGTGADDESLVYPEDDPRLEGELARLRELLPSKTVLLTGGRAMPAYRDALNKVGALQIKDLTHLGSILDELRKPSRKSKR